MTKRKSDDDELFSYTNTMELAFGKRTMKTKGQPQPDFSDSSSDDDSDEERLSLDSDSDDDAWKKNQDVSDSDEDSSELSNINQSVDKKDEEDKDDSFMSPSPPPPPKIVTQITKNRKAANSVRALDQALKILKENQISSPMTTSFGAREDLVLLDDTPVREMMVKVMCHGIVSKFKMKQTDMFFTLQDKISDKENTTREKVLITLRDQPIKGSDTPKSIGCTVADIIECVIMTDSLETSVEDKDPEKIVVKLQTKEAHSKKEYSIYKTDTLKKIITSYCQDRKIKMATLKVYFDGEKIDMNQTPQDLDIDNEDVLDLVHN